MKTQRKYCIRTNMQQLGTSPETDTYRVVATNHDGDGNPKSRVYTASFSSVKRLLRANPTRHETATCLRQRGQADIDFWPYRWNFNRSTP